MPALATQPVPMVVTGALMKRMTSWIASPDSTCPPGEEISTRIGASDCCAIATSRSHVVRATVWLISPNRNTKRDLNDSWSVMLSGRCSVRSGLSSLSSS